ncbi:MAG: DUF3850 domain-containing protein [Planctomycetes bacterium]|nr:DUF3850 domain-containing protein [Planctomycetota bacterium]
MRLHELKNHPVPFRDVWSSRKTFEIRVDDRQFEVGDVLHLREWDKLERSPHAAVDAQREQQPAPDQSARGYTGCSVLVLVLHMLRGPAYGLAEGSVCMSLKLLVRLPLKAKS